ncbi:MAG: AtpZ/AtpI family protein [Proteobacteria bacterium]|nr:AtpZ/AtpI family protein [Pseudomonadota bacterium]
MKQAEKTGDGRADEPAAWVQALRISTVGVEFGVGAVLGYLGGQWLDERWKTAPYLTLVGLLLGVAAAFASLFRLMREAQRREAERTENGDLGDGDLGDGDLGDGDLGDGDLDDDDDAARSPRSH